MMEQIAENRAKDVQRHAVSRTTSQETNEENSTFQKDHAVFLNPKGESQAQLSTVVGSLNSLSLSADLEEGQSDTGGIQYYSKEEEQHGNPIAGVQRPLQASDPPQTSSQSGEQLSANDSSVTCLHGEESEPPGTGLSALVPNLCYSDDDQRPVSKQWVKEQLQQMSAKHKEEITELERKFAEQIESVRRESQEKTELLKVKEKQLIDCKQKVEELEGMLQTETKENKELKQKLTKEMNMRAQLEQEVYDLKARLAEAERRVENTRSSEIMQTLRRIESSQQNMSSAQKKYHRQQMNEHSKTRQCVKEEALSQTTTSGGQEQSTSSPQATFFFPSSFDPPRDTSTNAGEDSGVACQHRFEHCPVESSVDPDN